MSTSFSERFATYYQKTAVIACAMHASFFSYSFLLAFLFFFAGVSLDNILEVIFLGIRVNAYIILLDSVKSHSVVCAFTSNVRV